jgi:hypothetical protein
MNQDKKKILVSRLGKLVGWGPQRAGQAEMQRLVGWDRARLVGWGRCKTLLVSWGRCKRLLVSRFGTARR